MNDEERMEAVGDWLLDAAMRRTGLSIIAAFKALIVDYDEQRYDELQTRLDELSDPTLIAGLLNVVALLISLSADPEDLLYNVELSLIDRPAPTLPEAS